MLSVTALDMSTIGECCCLLLPCRWHPASSSPTQAAQPAAAPVRGKCTRPGGRARDSTGTSSSWRCVLHVATAEKQRRRRRWQLGLAWWQLVAAVWLHVGRPAAALEVDCCCSTEEVPAAGALSAPAANAAGCVSSGVTRQQRIHTDNLAALSRHTYRKVLWGGPLSVRHMGITVRHAVPLVGAAHLRRQIYSPCTVLCTAFATARAAQHPTGQHEALECLHSP